MFIAHCKNIIISSIIPSETQLYIHFDCLYWILWNKENNFFSVYLYLSLFDLYQGRSTYGMDFHGNSNFLKPWFLHVHLFVSQTYVGKVMKVTREDLTETLRGQGVVKPNLMPSEHRDFQCTVRNSSIIHLKWLFVFVYIRIFE